MNLINTNYAIAKGPSFAAQLKLYSGKDLSYQHQIRPYSGSSLNNEQVELLKQLARGIGDDSDTIKFELGEPFGEHPSYEFLTTSTIGGKTTNGKAQIHRGNPYYNLSKYLIRLQRKCTIPGKLETLQKELATAEGVLQDATAKFSAAEEEINKAKVNCGYNDLLEAKDAAFAKKEAIESKIGELTEELNQVSKEV